MLECQIRSALRPFPQQHISKTDYQSEPSWTLLHLRGGLKSSLISHKFDHCVVSRCPGSMEISERPLILMFTNVFFLDMQQRHRCCTELWIPLQDESSWPRILNIMSRFSNTSCWDINNRNSCLSQLASIRLLSLLFLTHRSSCRRLSLHQLIELLTWMMIYYQLWIARSQTAS